MRKVLLAFLIFLGLGCSHGFPPRTADSVVQLIGKNKDGKKQSTGTGFAMMYKGKPVFITNAHVCERYPSMYVLKDRKEFEYKVIKISKKTDLCMLEGDLTFKPLLLAHQAPRDTTVYAIGFHHGEFKTVQQGFLKVYSTVKLAWGLPVEKCKGRKYLKVVRTGNIYEPVVCLASFDIYSTTIPAAPGGSGSPVVDSRGRVVSVVAAIETIGMPWAKTVILEHLKEFLRN